ncbi:MAG: tocopherol cyclase family protein [Candidatus Izemoplasmatales bacterium]
MYFKKIKQPEIYQGRNKQNHFFEGWYYKTVSPQNSISFALIPGISKNKKNSHAFIQVILYQDNQQSVPLKSDYFVFDTNEFSFQDNPFEIKIGENVFSKTRLHIHLKSDLLQIRGDLLIENLTFIQTSLWTPNIMGPFGYLNFMECYHGVISMNHEVSGELEVDGKLLSLSKAKGYIEKDWGKSFPKEYIWVQSNSFLDESTSLMFSYATIPFGFLSFKGLIANLLYQTKEYRFATYNRSKIKIIRLEDNVVKMVLKKGKYRLEIDAKTESTLPLKSPLEGLMVNSIKEGLFGYLKISLYASKKLVMVDESHHAGIEIMMKKS